MGQSPSLPSSLPNLALHCLRVADLSPASGLVEPFFDYLIDVETDPPSLRVQEEGVSGLSPVELSRILEENEGKRIGLKVYNAKSQRIRGGSSSSAQPSNMNPSPIKSSKWHCWAAGLVRGLLAHSQTSRSSQVVNGSKKPCLPMEKNLLLTLMSNHHYWAYHCGFAIPLMRWNRCITYWTCWRVHQRRWVSLHSFYSYEQ